MKENRKFVMDLLFADSTIDSAADSRYIVLQALVFR